MGKKEWSGILIFSIEEGSIDVPNSLVLKARDVYLMDIGSSAYTEYEFGQEAMKVYQQIPETDPFKCEEKGVKPWKFGTIHTHHGMDKGAFFSGTDLSDLKTNAPCHTFYLSLIVDWKCEYKAKIGVSANITETKKVTWNNGLGKEVEMVVDNKKKDVFNIDCNITFDEIEGFDKRIAEVRKTSKKVPEFTRRTFGGHPLVNPKTNTPDDISPNQQSMFDDKEMISDQKITEYLVGLFSVGTNIKSGSLEEIFQKVDMASEDMRQSWMDIIDDNIHELFEYSFPNTRYDVEELMERMCEVIEPQLQHFESAEMVYSHFMNIHVEYESVFDGSPL